MPLDFILILPAAQVLLLVQVTTYAKVEHPLVTVHS